MTEEARGWFEALTTPAILLDMLGRAVFVSLVLLGVLWALGMPWAWEAVLGTLCGSLAYSLVRLRVTGSP